MVRGIAGDLRKFPAFWCSSAVNGAVRAALWVLPVMCALCFAGACGFWIADPFKEEADVEPPVGFARTACATNNRLARWVIALKLSLPGIEQVPLPLLELLHPDDFLGSVAAAGKYSVFRAISRFSWIWHGACYEEYSGERRPIHRKGLRHGEEKHNMKSIVFDHAASRRSRRRKSLERRQTANARVEPRPHGHLNMITMHKSGFLESHRAVPVVRRQRDESADSEHWMQVEARLRVAVWLLVMVTTIVDVVVTFGPHFGLTWQLL